MKKKIQIFAISGVKNSGKTTLISRILPILSGYGLKVATIKHDGHDFDADVPGTDTYRHFHAGAYGTVIFSDAKYMVVKQQTQMTKEEMMAWFPEADLILLEGFKTCSYPKIELIRRGNSVKSVCEGYHLTAVATDMEPDELVLSDRDIPILDLNDPQAVAACILENREGQRSADALRCKTKLIFTREEDFFGPGVCQLLDGICETGSIDAAAKKMQMSYTKCLKMINRLEKEMGFPFLERCNDGNNGGSSTITEEGKQFIERYHTMAEKIRHVSQDFFNIYFRDYQ